MTGFCMYVRQETKDKILSRTISWANMLSITSNFEHDVGNYADDSSLQFAEKTLSQINDVFQQDRCKKTDNVRTGNVLTAHHLVYEGEFRQGYVCFCEAVEHAFDGL